MIFLIIYVCGALVTMYVCAYIAVKNRHEFPWPELPSPMFELALAIGFIQVGLLWPYVVAWNAARWAVKHFGGRR